MNKRFSHEEKKNIGRSDLSEVNKQLTNPGISAFAI